MLAYIEHPERFPWYDPETDWTCTPPLAEFRPEEDEIETVNSDHEEEAETENMLVASYTAHLFS